MFTVQFCSHSVCWQSTTFTIECLQVHFHSYFLRLVVSHYLLFTDARFFLFVTILVTQVIMGSMGNTPPIWMWCWGHFWCYPFIDIILELRVQTSISRFLRVILVFRTHLLVFMSRGTPSPFHYPPPHLKRPRLRSIQVRVKRKKGGRREKKNLLR